MFVTYGICLDHLNAYNIRGPQARYIISHILYFAYIRMVLLGKIGVFFT